MDDRNSDPFQRFVDAQSPVFAQAIEELRAGQKRSHWMWFIFPQLAGLGSSSMAKLYALSGRDEAIAYLQHETVGPRLRLAAETVIQVSGPTVDEIFSYPDNLKFHSSMTLFAQVAPIEVVFQQALEKYFAGQSDPATLALL